MYPTIVNAARCNPTDIAQWEKLSVAQLATPSSGSDRSRLTGMSRPIMALPVLPSASPASRLTISSATADSADAARERVMLPTIAHSITAVITVI